MPNTIVYVSVVCHLLVEVSIALRRALTALNRNTAVGRNIMQFELRSKNVLVLKTICP